MKAIAFVAAVLVASAASAQEAVIPPPTAEGAEVAAPPDQDVTPVLKDKKAPFTGLLVPEKRFTKLLEAEINLEATEHKLQAQLRFSDALEKMYQEKLKEAARDPAWYETPSFNRWVGFTIGIVVTGLVVWGGVEIVKATGNGT